jgi:hypothetical protein
VGPAPNDGNGDRLLYTERVSVEGLLGRTFAFATPGPLPLDRRASQAAVKVAVAN